MHKKPVRTNAEINLTMLALIINTRRSFNSETEITRREWSNGKNTVAAKKSGQNISTYQNV